MTEINTITWSDHASVFLTIFDSLAPGTNPVWRANPFLLQREDTRAILESHLKEYFVNNVDSVRDYSVLWNAHKAFMRGILIKVGAGVKRQRQKRIKELTDNIWVLESQNKLAPSPSLSQRLSQLRFDLRLCLMEDFEKFSR